MSTIEHPLIERLRASGAPVADLVGFSIEPLGDGKALGWLDAGPRHAASFVLCDQLVIA